MRRPAFATRALPARRRGASMVFVVFALGLSLVVSLSFMRAQMAVTRIGESRLRTGEAVQAARTGLMSAVAAMRSADWSGVGTVDDVTLFAEPGSVTRYEIRYSAVDDPRYPDDVRPWLVRAESTGIWESANGESVRRKGSAVLKLNLRLDDSRQLKELAPNPSVYDVLQEMALTAHGSNSTSLVLDPGTRIHGPMVIRNRISLYNDPGWSSTVRRTLLSQIGNRDGNLLSPEQMRHPHPLGGRIYFLSSPDEWLQNDLSRLQVPYSTVESNSSVPRQKLDQWREYRLFAGGPIYQATVIGNSLSNQTFRPSVDNPLGILFHDGNVTLHDQVDIQGTLVCTGRVFASGKNVRISAYNWRRENGDFVSARMQALGRLPALIADEFDCSRETTCTVEGGIVLEQGLRGGGAEYQLEETSDPLLMFGLAVAEPKGHPFSEIHFALPINLGIIDDSGRYSIYVDSGTNGRWFPIVGIGRLGEKVTVLGEADVPGVFGYKIARTRKSYVDIVGHVIGEDHDLNVSRPWMLESEQWNSMKSEWESDNSLLGLFRLPLINFADWLANPNNFHGWGSDYERYGLPLQPVYHISLSTQYSSRWAPPVIAPYLPEQPQHAESGYRWEVVRWEEPR